MRIPSGDLAPARKHRKYGRRRPRRSPLPALLGVLLLLLVAGGAYLYHRSGDAGATPAAGALAQPSRCPSPVPVAQRPAVTQQAVVLPVPGKVQLRLLNGTGRNGLARTVGNELARRGFRVAGMGNAPTPLTGATRIAYGPGARPAAMLVGVHVIGSQLVPTGAAPRGSVDVVLGSTFVRLRNAAEVKAATLALAHPVAKTAAKPAARPTCR